METDFRSRPRRRHEPQFKAEVVAACAEPGASVAEVARRFGVNDDLVHRWRRGHGTGKASPGAGIPKGTRPMEFVAVSLPAPVAGPAVLPTAAEVEPIHREPGATDARHAAGTASTEAAGGWSNGSTKPI